MIIACPGWLSTPLVVCSERVLKPYMKIVCETCEIVGLLSYNGHRT